MIVWRKFAGMPRGVRAGVVILERKRRALDCHVTQFGKTSGGAETRLNVPAFRQLIESRDAQFGALAGVTWAEGFVVREPVVRTTLFK